jgi:hypothetical protein
MKSKRLKMFADVRLRTLGRAGGFLRVSPFLFIAALSAPNGYHV